MQLFYSKDITTGGLCSLDTEESRHAVRVLRLREGDDLHVTDGRGHLFRCRIVTADERACSVEALECSEPQGDRPRLHLAVAPTKNPSRMEWLVEKAVEMGIISITLLQSDHSERVFMKTDRLERLTISAMKQSLHLTLPEITAPTPLRDWLTANCYPLNAQRFIAHCEADKPRTSLTAALKPGTDAVVLIGPEGDFSADEIALALQQGFLPVSFGDARLRTETAALYAVAAFNYINN